MQESNTAEVQEPEVTETTEPQTINETTQEVKSTKTYTQDEFNNAMASVRKKTETNVLKKFEGVDVAKYNALVEAEEAKALEEQKARGEFEKVLKDTVTKKDSEIQTLTQKLQSQQIDGALLNAASKYKAIAPEQVKKLLRDNVRLNANGDVEVLDETGAVRYNDKGEILSVDEFSKEWLEQNPHFAQPGAKGSGSQSNTAPTKVEQVDVTKLDLNDPAQKELYRQHRNSRLSKARSLT